MRWQLLLLVIPSYLPTYRTASQWIYSSLPAKRNFPLQTFLWPLIKLHHLLMVMQFNYLGGYFRWIIFPSKHWKWSNMIYAASVCLKRNGGWNSVWNLIAVMCIYWWSRLINAGFSLDYRLIFLITWSQS